ncbi:sarcosine oxidase subunit gamma [Ancylobacter lacus]|uniref:sarcosine oxidase subunit gamma n=1 Tax=Ancylobacter lacus TaxID=2579970 RepID=UPI001FE96902|nr:sarcosine oxidase subunit gamma family protein [Ancylobacter lacus]
MSSPAHPLSHTRPIPAGHHGRPGTAGVVARWREDLAIATLAARHGGEAALAAAMDAAFGLALPAGPKAAGANGVSALGLAPRRWLVLASQRPALAAELAGLGGGAVTEQSDGYAVLDLAGPEVRAVLAKLVAVDLDPAVFSTGDVVASSLAHIGAVLWQTGEEPTYRLLVGTSFAAAFSHTLLAAAAEYGLDLADAGRGPEAGRGTGRG